MDDWAFSSTQRLQRIYSIAKGLQNPRLPPHIELAVNRATCLPSYFLCIAFCPCSNFSNITSFVNSGLVTFSDALDSILIKITFTLSRASTHSVALCYFVFEARPFPHLRISLTSVPTLPVSTHSSKFSHAAPIPRMGPRPAWTPSTTPSCPPSSRTETAAPLPARASTTRPTSRSAPTPRRDARTGC